MSEMTDTADCLAVGIATAKPTRKRSTAAALPVVSSERRRSKRPASRLNPAANEIVTTKPPSKSMLVLKLLTRTKGATIAEMEEPTGWQPHSTRAFLSGLRKKGVTVTRDQRRTGETAYRTGAVAIVSLSAATTPPDDSSTLTTEGDTYLIGSGGAATEPVASNDPRADSAPASEATA